MEQVSLLDYLEESSEANDKRIKMLVPGESIVIGRYTLTYNTVSLYEVETKDEHYCLSKDIEEVLKWLHSLYD